MPRFPSLPVEAERELLAQAKGDAAARRAAFDTVFTTLREPVLALCLHLTGRRADAEDAVQDVFFAVHRALGGFRGESRLSTWVYRIALRAAFRAKSRQVRTEALDPEFASAGSEEWVLATRDEARRLLAALQRLPAEHRIVLSLFAIEGLTHPEIAEILGIPLGTVWSRLHSARKRLAEALPPP